MTFNGILSGFNFKNIFGEASKRSAAIWGELVEHVSVQIELYLHVDTADELRSL